MDDAQSPLAKDVVVLREGQDLVLMYPDGVRVVIENYFEVCRFGRCEVLLPELRYSREDAERVSLDESVSLFALDGVPVEGYPNTWLLASPTSEAVFDEIAASDPMLSEAGEMVFAGVALAWPILGVLGVGGASAAVLDSGDSRSELTPSFSSAHHLKTTNLTIEFGAGDACDPVNAPGVADDGPNYLRSVMKEFLDFDGHEQISTDRSPGSYSEAPRHADIVSWI